VKKFLSRNLAATIMVGMIALEREMPPASPMTRTEEGGTRAPVTQQMQDRVGEHPAAQHATLDLAALTKDPASSTVGSQDTRGQATDIRTATDQAIGQVGDMPGEVLLLGIKTLWILGAVGREVKVESHLQK